jgi:hypothetical protein
MAPALKRTDVANLRHRRYAFIMRPLRYSINVTLDGCCDHRAIPADEALHRHAIDNLDRADALLFGRVTYEMMETAFRPPAGTEARPEWMKPFARAIDAAKKYVVSSIEHPAPCRLERGTRSRESGDGRPAAQAGAGQGTAGGRRNAPPRLGGAGIDRRIRNRGAPQAGGLRTDVVLRAVEAHRLETREPAGVGLRGGGDAL